MRLFVDARCAAPDKREDALGPRELGQLPTGWPDLDEKLGGGMRAGSLVIVGARPSVGKTSAALGMVLAATQEKLPSVFVTLEQSQIDIANRLLSAITSLPLAQNNSAIGLPLSSMLVGRPAWFVYCKSSGMPRN